MAMLTASGSIASDAEPHPELAWVFPGQGSQAVGMGRDLYDRYPAARQIFDEADDALGFRLSRLCFEGPEEELRQTINTQPAIVTTSIACFAAAYGRLEVVDGAPAFVAGHSLGEYSALIAAGALSFSDGVRLVRERGRLMQEAGERNPGTRATDLAKARGAAKVTPLSVSAAFHSSLMQPAVEGMRRALLNSDLQDPRIPVVG